MDDMKKQFVFIGEPRQLIAACCCEFCPDDCKDIDYGRTQPLGKQANMGAR